VNDCLRLRFKQSPTQHNSSSAIGILSPMPMARPIRGGGRCAAGDPGQRTLRSRGAAAAGETSPARSRGAWAAAPRSRCMRAREDESSLLHPQPPRISRGIPLDILHRRQSSVVANDRGCTPKRNRPMISMGRDGVAFDWHRVRPGASPDLAVSPGPRGLGQSSSGRFLPQRRASRESGLLRVLLDTHLCTA